MNFSTNRQSLFCGNDRIAVIMEISDEISIMTWKTLRVSHNPLEKTSSFPHFTQKHLLLKKGNYNCRQREIIVDIKQYSRFDKKTYENHYIDRPFSQESETLDIPLKAFAAGMEQTTSAVELLSENLVVFIKLCEEVIHDRGTWPENIPYPRS